MTIYVKIRTVTAAIAALSISGVTIKDLSGIPSNANLLAKTLYPNPESGTIQGFLPVRQTKGIGGGERVNIGYGIKYRYLHCTPNALNAGDVIDDLVNTLSTIFAALIADDAVSGAVDLWIDSVSDFPAIVNDPAGNPFWGCDFVVTIQEFAEVAP